MIVVEVNLKYNFQNVIYNSKLFMYIINMEKIRILAKKSVSLLVDLLDLHKAYILTNKSLEFSIFSIYQWNPKQSYKSQQISLQTSLYFLFTNRILNKKYKSQHS
jgi:hypothetical protein